MIKNCAHCGAEFAVDKRHPHQRFCSNKCACRNRDERARWFKAEWTAWKRDFALNKTQSNLEALA